MSIAPIRIEMTLQCAAEVAFDTFTEGFGSWWPSDYTWSGESLKAIGIEPHEGGRCTEVGPHGFQCDFGRILKYEPPGHLHMTWQISPDRQPVPEPDLASEISVNFQDLAEGCKVTFEHSHIERHGKDAQSYRDSLAAKQGWPYILELYAKGCNGQR